MSGSGWNGGDDRHNPCGDEGQRPPGRTERRTQRRLRRKPPDSAYHSSAKGPAGQRPKWTGVGSSRHSHLNQGCSAEAHKPTKCDVHSRIRPAHTACGNRGGEREDRDKHPTERAGLRGQVYEIAAHVHRDDYADEWQRCQKVHRGKRQTSSGRQASSEKYDDCCQKAASSDWRKSWGAYSNWAAHQNGTHPSAREGAQPDPANRHCSATHWHGMWATGVDQWLGDSLVGTECWTRLLLRGAEVVKAELDATGCAVIFCAPSLAAGQKLYGSACRRHGLCTRA